MFRITSFFIYFLCIFLLFFFFNFFLYITFFIYLFIIISQSFLSLRFYFTYFSSLPSKSGRRVEGWANKNKE